MTDTGTAPDDQPRDWEAENRAKIVALNAKPWRGVCPACPGRMWCTDSEGEATRLISEHIETEHIRLTPQVWRDHDDSPETTAEAKP